jgi:hypothetical protein
MGLDSYLQYEPIRYNLGARVSPERRNRFVNSRVRASAAITVVSLRQLFELALKIRIRQRPDINARRQDPEIAKQRGGHSQARRELISFARWRALAPSQILRRVEPAGWISEACRLP